MTYSSPLKALNSRSTAIGLSIMLFAPSLAAQGDPTGGPIEMIAVSADPEQGGSRGTITRHRLDPSEFQRVAPVTSADLIGRLPSARVAANSRGQTLVTLRGTGERQVAVFYDGALLNIPWDNRYDLAALPAGAIGAVQTAVGPISPQYGVNAHGAVLLDTPTITDGRGNARLFGGSGGQLGGDATLGLTYGDTRILAAVGGFRQDAQTLPGGIDLPFHQDGDNSRVNTVREQLSLLLRAEHDLPGGALTATLLYSDVNQGIAPESDRSDARFWRYPTLRTAMGILKGQFVLTDSTDLSVTAWVQDYEQSIDSFASADYAVLEDQQDDDDRTYGLRAQSRYQRGILGIVLSGNVVRSRHRQQDTDLTGDIPQTSMSSFAQTLISIGSDITLDLTPDLLLDAAIGYDRADYTDSGPFPPPPVFDASTLRIALRWQASEHFSLRATAGRKDRMPTLRDLFGTAIDRFLINPDLQAETIRSTEVGAQWRTDSADIQLTGFFQDVDDTIDQIRIGPLRQRVNLTGSRIWGLEAAGRAALTDDISLDGNVSWMRIRQTNFVGGGINRLAERPSVQARLSLNYEPEEGIRAGVETLFTGRAFSPDDDGVLQALPTALSVNLFASLPLWRGDGRHASLFVRGDNITDEVIIPQAGLPAPGRTIRGGLTLLF